MPSSPRPTPIDGFPTLTSATQAETESVLLKHLPDPGTPAPTLSKNAHLQFLIRNLVQGFPQRYTSQDASQPWLLFWSLQAFAALQVGIDPANRQRMVRKIMAWQHPDGGFGGGPGQQAHLLPTYASVCALAIVGGPGPEGGWDQIDRQKMHAFFMSLKQPDGSFLVSRHAEVDVRGIYCLLVTATLLGILTPELVRNTPAFLASCQTYEGGFASASQPYFSPAGTLLSSPRPALGEAHGGYTFCALASWILLQPFIDPQSSESPKINARRLLRWLVQMQGVEAELGGFKGRTNKLVDGCYSWWNGGSFALLEALGVGPRHEAASEDAAPLPPEGGGESETWHDADDSLFDRKALQEYILLAGQHPAGGLRDKPPKAADAYHTAYCLSGLSAAQHKVVPSPARRHDLHAAWTTPSAHDPDAEIDAELRKRIFCDALCWSEEEGSSLIVGGKDNRVNATHPLFNLTVTHAEGIMAHFYRQTVPPRVRRFVGRTSAGHSASGPTAGSTTA